MKKVLCAVLAIVLLLGLCACGTNAPSYSGDKYDKEGKVTLTVGLRSNAKIISFEDNALTKWLEETTGVNIEIVEFAGGSDVTTQISTTIAARQDLPDILWGVTLSAGTLETYGHEGYLVDMRPYFDDKEGASKTFWTRMEESLSDYQQEYILNKLIDPDTGGIYAVPTVETSLVDGIHYMAWINTEWLDKLGLEEPTNNQELYDMLVAFRDKDPNGNGLKDEIPLFGTQASMPPAKVLDMLVNTFMYYNPSHSWQDYDGDGQLEHAQIQDEYREALKFINKLYKEKLLTSMVYTVKSDEMQQIITPSNGVPLVGMFCGHLTLHATFGNELLYNYKAVTPWGAVCERDMGFNLTSMITETAQKRGVVDEAFNLLMTMWSWDGSMRIRYGEYGVNWTDPDPGATSDYGLPATYKVLKDGMEEQGSQVWGSASGSLNHYCEGETAQTNDGTNPWIAAKSQMHAEARRIYDEAEKTINPTFLENPVRQSFILNSQEEESISMQKTNVNAWITQHVKDFVCGTNKQDINDDADWKAYVDGVYEQGYEDVQKMYQTAYERQEKK